jgi:hypothetical protein
MGKGRCMMGKVKGEFTLKGSPCVLHLLWQAGHAERPRRHLRRAGGRRRGFEVHRGPSISQGNAPRSIHARRVLGDSPPCWCNWVDKTRLDLLAATSVLAQSLSDPRVSHEVAANSLVKAAAQNADLKLAFRSDIGENYNDCRILCSSDSAFTNAIELCERIKSQAGFVLGVRSMDGSKLHLLELSTGTEMRVWLQKLVVLLMLSKLRIICALSSWP